MQAYIISRGEKALKHWDYTMQRLNSAWSTLGVQKTEPVFGHYQVPHNSNASCFVEGIVRPCRPGDHQVEIPNSSPSHPSPSSQAENLSRACRLPT